jgi:hypothetical protein
MEETWGLFYDMAICSDVVYGKKEDIIRTCLGMGTEINVISSNNNFCFIGENRSYNIIVFRGSDDIEDFKKDLNYKNRKIYSNDYRVHKGFNSIWEDLLPLISPYIKELSKNGKMFYVCGHSLGGAIAVLCGIYLSNLVDNISIYTFACPRFIKGSWNNFLKERKNFNVINFINRQDPVMKIPLWLFGWKRLGSIIKIGPGGFWNVVKGIKTGHLMLRYKRIIWLKINGK